MTDVTHNRRVFVFEDTANQDYRYIRMGLLRRGWQQINLPRHQRSDVAREEHNRFYRDPSKDPDRVQSSWVKRQGGVGVASVGQKGVSLPDLIWTISCGRLRGLGRLGKEQVTNLLEGSSCLTSKAGLRRSLQSMNCPSSGGKEGLAQPQSFFPRCFDLSDPSQVDEFKDNFRKTAAAAIVKVYSRLLSEPPGFLAPNSSVGRAAPDVHVEDKNDFLVRKCREVRKHGHCDCFGDAHGWMLSLAMRVCRRRLLNKSGWRGGDSLSVNGAETLTSREWDSLLFYSYVLRRAVQPSLDYAAHMSTTTDNKALEKDRSEVIQSGFFAPGECDGREALKPEKGGRSSDSNCIYRDACNGCPADIKLRKIQRLRSVPVRATIAQSENGLCSRRQTSASARLRSINTVNEDRPHVQQTNATSKIHTVGSGAVWGLKEHEELHDGLSKIWTPSGVIPSTCCTCLCGSFEDRSWANCTCLGEGKKEQNRNVLPHLAFEAAQLCTALEKRCPQWNIDGEKNLWILKPAEASRGKGVRLAWTMNQILYAQKSMGGRVVQKYVETSLLLHRLPRRSPMSTRPDRKMDSRTQCSSIQGNNFDLGGRGRARRWRREKGGGLGGASVGSLRKTKRLPLSNVDEKPSSRGGGAAKELFRSLDRVRDERSVRAKNTHPMDAEMSQSVRAKKFDIRLWVLVTEWDPLKLFIFDQCYLRVCPKRFSLVESEFRDPDVHLTNLCARRPANAGLKASLLWQRRRRKRKFSSTGRTTYCTTGRKSEDVRDSNGAYRKSYTNASLSMRPVSANEQQTSSGEDSYRGECKSDNFVASQAELIQRLGEIGECRGLGRLPAKQKGSKKDEWRARGKWIWRKIVSPSIQKLVTSTFVAAHSHMQPEAPSFQLFGFDLLLDREFNPWLLEVNLSPALSHSSEHKSALIRSMCEGLLCLTVDRIFPLPRPSSSDVGDGRFNSDEPESSDEVGKISVERLDRGRCSRFGKWRPVTISQLSNHCGLEPEAIWSPSVASVTSIVSRCITPASTNIGKLNAKLFYIQGRHLTKRGLLRAERGLREAIAVNTLAIWWKSRVGKVRKWRARKVVAVATIRRRVVRAIAGRRRRALCVRCDRAARIIQRKWRFFFSQKFEFRRLTKQIEACVFVQTLWRFYRLKCRSRFQHTQRKVLVFLMSWARAVLCRRRKRAAETIYRAAALAALRRKKKQKAATVIARKLHMVCIRRRQSRSRLQQFARIPCLLWGRLAAQRSERAASVQRKAAATISRTLRKAVAQSNHIRNVSAVGTLQKWFQFLLQKLKQRQKSAYIVHQASRLASRRNTWAASVKLQPVGDFHLQYSIPSSMEESKSNQTLQDVSLSAKPSTSCRLKVNRNFSAHISISPSTTLRDIGMGQRHGDSAPLCMEHTEGCGARSLEPSGSKNRSRAAFFDCTRDTSPKSISRITFGAPSPKEEDANGRFLVVKDDEDTDTVSISGDSLLSPTSTAHESWLAPTLVFNENKNESCSGRVAKNENSSYGGGSEDQETAVSGLKKVSRHSFGKNKLQTIVQINENSKFSPPRISSKNSAKISMEKERSLGIFTLDCIFPTQTQNKRKIKPVVTRGGKPELCHLRRPNVSRHNASCDGTSRGMVGGRMASPLYSGRGDGDSGFPYPMIGGTQTIDSWTKRRPVQLRVADGPAKETVETSLQAFSRGNRSRAEKGDFACLFPLSCACKTASFGARKNVYEQSREWARKTDKSYPGSWAKMLLRKKPMGVKEEPKQANGMFGVEHNATFRGGDSSIQFRGESGAVLQMLAFLET